ncbi:MAG: hypothetical protein SO155_06725 [Candidatus Ventricola sp.]|nr:hypothetical protein [Candidatus Ventricola sp.]
MDIAHLCAVCKALLSFIQKEIAQSIVQRALSSFTLQSRSEVGAARPAIGGFARPGEDFTAGGMRHACTAPPRAVRVRNGGMRGRAFANKALNGKES